VSHDHSYTRNVIADVTTRGLDEDYVVGTDENKDPRGILNYELSGHKQSDITWKITGNLGGESYADHSRGPLNEGGTFAERQGYHLPGAPTTSWEARSPFQGTDKPGVGFFATTFELSAPAGYDIPLSFSFTNTTGNGPTNYRIQLFVNGWQFGKYVNQVGPQTSFPVPRGILNYEGSNYLALTIWGMDAHGVKLGTFKLVPTVLVQSGYANVDPVPATKWSKRKGAY
jgi:Beta-galactosidase jelly roll domain